MKTGPAIKHKDQQPWPSKARVVIVRSSGHRFEVEVSLLGELPTKANEYHLPIGLLSVLHSPR